MLIKGINLPEILLRAQEAGELVIFAGAGVSYPPPSKLPLFDGLALSVGENSGIRKDEGEPADHYLDTLTFENTPVFLRLDEKKQLARSFPDATADFVLLYLQSPLKYFFPDEKTANIWRELCQGGVDLEKLKRIREAMYRLGHDPGEPPQNTGFPKP